MKFYNKITVLLLLATILVSSVTASQNGNTRVTTHPSNPNISQSHPTGPPATNPANITIIKGLDRARELVTAKTQFKIVANTTNPFFLWGDKNYSIQNLLQLNSIVEYSDQNNNLVFDQNEAVKTLDFQKYVTWNFTRDEINDSTVMFTLYSNKINQTGFANTQINLTQYMVSSNTNFLKFDIVISNWNWVSTTDRLAIIFDFSLSRSNDKAPASLSNKSGIKVNNTTNDGLFIKNNSNQTIGYLLSSNKAFKGSNNESIMVKNQFQINPANETAFIILNYPYFGNYLFHDPVIGSYGYTVLSQLYTILIGQSGLLTITSVLTIISIFAMYFMRKRK